MSEKIIIASDHAGVDLKSELVTYLNSLNYIVYDLGPKNSDSVDYPDYAHKAAKAFEDKLAEKAVLICGSGIGISIAANRHHSIRAALCHTVEHAKLAREHNDANILCLGARFSNVELAKKCLDVFLNTSFEGGRHKRRVEKINPSY